VQLLTKKKSKRNNNRQDAFHFNAYFYGLPFCFSYVLGIDYEFYIFLLLIDYLN
jgi:hypothetical protein